MKIFSGSVNVPLAESIAKSLDIDISPRELFVFPDGERRVQIQENVVDVDCIVVQPTSTPVDQNYMELFFLCDGLKRSGACEVIAVIPYFGYQRQDHIFRDGEAVSLEVIIKFLEAVHVDRLIAFDLHSIKIPELFSIPVSHLSALHLFANVIKENNWQDEETVLISPDMGGIRRIKQLSEFLEGMSFAAVEKNRDLRTGNIEAIAIEGRFGKRAIMVDDMISSGETMVKAAELLVQNGFEEVIAMASHAVFSKDAQETIEQSLITRCIVTDSVFVPEEKRFPKLEIISIADMVAKEIRKILEK